MNGVNLINDGHPFWGIITVSLTFTPVAIVGLYPFLPLLGYGLTAFATCSAATCCLCSPCGLLLLCLAIIFGLALYIQVVIGGTALYLLFVLGSGCIKALRPDIESLDEDDKVLCCVKPGLVNRATPVLRTAEVATESYPQSILGE